ncbi:MAG: hypothetical protein GY847_01375 [Proteobacteria bacterium]|nr:hypothetical protein [Pseudomonadota bacterium]
MADPATATPILTGIWTQLGVGGIFCVVLLRQIFDFLLAQGKIGNSNNGDGKKKEGEEIVCPLDRAETIAAVKWLKDQSEVRNGEGQLLIHFPREIKSQLEDISGKTAESNVELRLIHQELVRLNDLKSN